MKLPINKKVYRDALRRTRIIRIVSLLVGIIMTVNAVDFPGGDAIVSTGIVMMATQATGMLAFLLLGEMIIHGYRRKRKWDFFRTLPASKAEWFWTSLLAEMTNMVLYILVTEAAVVIASFRMERRSMDNLMPGKLRFYPSEQIHRVILLFDRACISRGSFRYPGTGAYPGIVFRSATRHCGRLLGNPRLGSGGGQIVFRQLCLGVYVLILPNEAVPPADVHRECFKCDGCSCHRI